jgi:hydroxymethylpyrimidine pyrophosphatase-like HAD family hydrolase
MSKLPYIVAIDFDGTLVEDKFPEIGAPRIDLIHELRELQENHPDWKFILWTCRTGRRLEEAVEVCERFGLRMDAINDNLEEVKTLYQDNARKIFADVYIDDKNAMVVGIKDAIYTRLGLHGS